ncbi:MAG TPA: hypothetical protein VFW94_24200 [Candidatus Acidoferrales bacterium]|nr:hypothetical protein [Candidatus Acidoferrales bacterium]
MAKLRVQNLNEKPTGNGTILRHGRAWLYGGGHRTLAHCEWVFFTHFCGVNFTLGGRGDEDCISFSLACWLFSFWFALDWTWLQNVLLAAFSVEKYEDRELSLSWHDGAFFWNLWTPSMEWSKAKHGRRQGAWHPVDTIFGRNIYEEVPIRESRIEIPMPECPYPATVKFYEARWRRRRWPFGWKRFLRADITPDTPIPFPGKGESAWDCGEDAMHSLTCTSTTDWEAIGAAVQSVMRSRIRYGGMNWRPATQKTSADSSR